MPWHGLGVRLPARASHEEIVQAAGSIIAAAETILTAPAKSKKSR